MEEKRKYNKLDGIEYKDSLIQVRLTSDDYNTVRKLANETGFNSISAYVRNLIKQEISKSV